MLRFRQYLSEIFRVTEKELKSHPELTRDEELSRDYVYEPKDESGKSVRHGVIRTHIGRYHPDSHKWNVHFTVGGSHSWLPTQDFPSNVTKVVFDHIQHHVARHRSETGESPVLVYDTAHPKKERIYKAAAKRLGIKAVNTGVLDTDLDRKERRTGRFVQPNQDDSDWAHAVRSEHGWRTPPSEIETRPYRRPNERLDEDMPYMTDTGSRRPGFDYKSEPEIPTELGKIGSYRVFHHKNHEEAGTEAVSIVHRNKQVGVIPIERYSGRISPSYPMVAAAHSSRRARVKNLMPKVYGLIADKLGTIESGSEQTPGSRSVWARLARMREVRVKGPDAQKRVTRTYSHPEHPSLEMSDSRHGYYSRRYRDLKTYTRLARGTGRTAQSNARFASATLRELRSSLHRSGMPIGKARNIRTFDQLPHPRSFQKKVTREAPITGRYSPEKHDATVYHPDRGGSYTLLLPGRKRTK